MWHLPISAGSVGDSSKKGCQCSCCAGGFVQATAMVTELCRKSEQVFGQQHGGDRWLEALRLPELRVCSGLSHTWLCRGARPSRPTLPGLSAGFASTPLTHPPGIFSSHRDLVRLAGWLGQGAAVLPKALLWLRCSLGRARGCVALPGQWHRAQPPPGHIHGVYLHHGVQSPAPCPGAVSDSTPPTLDRVRPGSAQWSEPWLKEMECKDLP